MSKKSLDKLVMKLNKDFNKSKEKYEEEVEYIEAGAVDSGTRANTAAKEYSKLRYIFELIEYLNHSYHTKYSLPKMPLEFI